MPKLSTVIKDFWVKYESKIVLVAGLCLVGALSFEAGILIGNTAPNQPIIIEKPAAQLVAGATEEKVPQAQILAPEAKNGLDSINIPAQNCAFTGSKNSDIYHLPTCSYAKRIKPENIVCFKDENEAKSKGYKPDKNCIKN